MADSILDGKNKAISDLAKMVSDEKEASKENSEVDEVSEVDEDKTS